MDLENLYKQRENLQQLMTSQYVLYREAIQIRKPLNVAKNIYKQIKYLEKQIQELTAKIHEFLKIGE